MQSRLSALLHRVKRSFLENRPDWMGRTVERLLWRSRHLVVVATFFGVLTSVVLFLVASRDAWNVLTSGVRYALGSHHNSEARSSIVAGVVVVLDGYLLATLLIVLSLGLYSLFVRRIDVAIDEKDAQHVVDISSIDELKTRIVGIIVMLAIVRFLELALFTSYTTPLDILILSASIVLIALSVPLLHRTTSHAKETFPEQ